MIDYEGNNYQPEPQQPEQPKQTHNPDRLTGKELEDALYASGFRPFGYEW